MTINTDLKVGSLEETLTVTGAAPTVDVQSTTKSQVLNRETLDAIPTGRTIQGMGQLHDVFAVDGRDEGLVEPCEQLVDDLIPAVLQHVNFSGGGRHARERAGLC